MSSTDRSGYWMRDALLALVSVCMLCNAGVPTAGAAESAAPAFGLDELSVLLHRETAATARFQELQYRKVLKVPLERAGELQFAPPALFEKRVLTPVIETYRLEGDTLSIELPQRRTRQISLRNQPLLGGLLLGFKAVVSGRLETLEPAFATSVSGTAASWTLLLEPRASELARYIDHILVVGQELGAQRFEVLERNGDRTVTVIEPQPR